MKTIFLALMTLQATLALAKTPGWIQDSKKGCRPMEICATGTGESRNAAERNARVALSKIFDTKINSKFTTALKAEGKDVVENVSEEISEATESAIAGVEIQKHFEDKQSFYALASLNKSKTAAAFKKQIEQIDAQLVAISKGGESVQKIKLEKLFVKREVLNRQHDFLTGTSIPSPVSYEDVFNAKSAASKSVVVHVYLDEDEPKQLEGILQGLISNQGFKVTSGQKKSSSATHVITGEYVADKQYMNVEGFEKYKFVLKLRAMRSATKEETGHLNYDVVETGRNFSQAHEKAQAKVQEYLKANIDDLNLE